MNTSDILPLPNPHGLEPFTAAARDLYAVSQSGGLPATQAHVEKQFPNLLLIRGWKLSSPFTPAEAEATVARAYGFGSASVFRIFLEGLAHPDSPVALFEAAADAVVDGDGPALEALLARQPQLVYGRSMRLHGATLLHYVAANGVENYRQRTPADAVLIAQTLLRAGAEVDAVTGSSTALGLVATSVHPQRAGVQIALLETLLSAGASVEGAPGGGSPVLAALANGRPEAAAWLAAHGATTDLVTAAGIGRLDLVETFFEGSSDFLAAAGALVYAGRYGHTDVVRFFLQKGVAPGAQDDRQYTALHWAAHEGYLDTARYLLEQRAPLELKNCYGGTVLGQTLWSAVNAPSEHHPDMVALLIGAGAVVESGTLRWWVQQSAPAAIFEGVGDVLRRHAAALKPRMTSPVCRALGVADVERSLAFYKEVLGFEVRDSEALYGPARISFTLSDSPPAIVFFHVADLDAFWDKLRARGARPTTPERVNWIKYSVVEVEDPDGHRLWFAKTYQEPSIPLSKPVQLKAINPELPCTDIPNALAYYRDVLGFSVNYAQHDLCVMDRDKVRILLVSRSPHFTGIGACYLYVTDVDDLYAELTAKGVQTRGEPVTYPWGLRSFTILDPEGNRVSFAQTFE